MTLDVIHRSLLISNSSDYDSSVIDYQVNNHYTLDWVSRKLESSYFILALLNEAVVGTGILEADEVKSVFVDPSHQRTGIGKKIMMHLEKRGKELNLLEVKLNSSITGLEFYKKLGYNLVTEQVDMVNHVPVYTYLMKKTL